MLTYVSRFMGIIFVNNEFFLLWIGFLGLYIIFVKFLSSLL